jgi:hypothetical protein
MKIDRNDLLSAPVRELETVPVPARRLTHREPAQQSPEDQATVFDQRQHISLHVVGQLSRLREAGPLVEATAIAVVALDLDGQMVQALPPNSVSPASSNRIPTPPRCLSGNTCICVSSTDSADRRTNCANPMTSPLDSATKKLDPCAASARLKLSNEYQLSSNRRWTSSGMMPA